MKISASLTALLLTGMLAAPATAHEIVYLTSLSGPAEVQPNNSPGTGSGRVTLDFDTLSMRVEATFSGLLGTTTASHIHCCTTQPLTGPAGVATQVPSFSGFPLGVTAGSYDHTFDMFDVASYNPAFVTANGGTLAGAFAALAGGLDGGRAYLNIHSSSFPGGEIRGFLQPVPEPSTWALLIAGLGAVVWVGRRRLSAG